MRACCISMSRASKTKGITSTSALSLAQGFLLFSILVVFSSCQKLTALVREERKPCPAWVTITSSPDVDKDTWSYVHLYLPHVEDSYLEERKIRTDEFNGGQVIEWTKNTDFAVVGLAGWSGEIKGLRRTESSLENGLILITRGRECPLAKGGAVSSTLTDDELYTYTMQMRSLFARVKFNFLGETTPGGEIAAEVDGWVDGYSIPDFTIHQGEFFCMAHNEGTDQTEARIPRQEDPDGISYASKLRVSFYYRESSSADWQHITDTPLGNVLTNYKYDWQKDNLDDIVINVTRKGKKVTKVEVSSGDWTASSYLSK